MGKTKEIKEIAPPPLHPWHCFSIEETTKGLELGPNVLTTGLSENEVTQSLEKYGRNRLTEGEEKTLLQRIWDLVANVLVFILFVVAVVSAIQAVIAMISGDSDKILTNWIQFGLIVFVVTVNTMIGLYQEGAAASAADALKSMLSSEARVIRGGVEKMVDAGSLVPGDVVVLSTGDKIPADIRLFETTQLSCLEAALTGEAVPIDKVTESIPVPDSGKPNAVPLGDRKNMCFSATLVAEGSGKGVIISTGDFTQIGTISSLVQQTEKIKTDVLTQMDTVSKYLAFFISIVMVITFFVAVFLTKQQILEAISTALTCAVAMIPEGLEAIITMTYSYAVTNMAKKNAIIRALPAVETLGSVTVICSDKTGTLTKNEMSVVAFVTDEGRFKVDVNSSSRGGHNFKRDDKYLSQRADVEEKKDDGVTKNTSGDFVAEGKSPSDEYVNGALACGVLCSKCVLGKNGTREGEIGNPTEISILRAAYFGNVDVVGIKETSKIVAEVPFNSAYKFMSTVHEPIPSVDGAGYEDYYVAYVKGAPDRMVPLCKNQASFGRIGKEFLKPIDAEWWLDTITTLSSHGLRVLALCRAYVPKSEIEPGQLGPEFVNGRSEKWLTLVGLCAIQDPPRPECIDAIKEAHRAGVRVAMITGDHKDTACAIGRQLNIVDDIYRDALTGPELDALSDEATMEAVLTHNVFARASPENKIQIVKALQACGQTCSMTGDGVNDAPALKAANMGVAMGIEGTDVAREAAEMILADDNFATIVYAVKEGRVVWDDLRKVLLVNTPVNNAQGLSVLVGLALGMPEAPLTPIQVLYSNLICAVTLGFVCAVEPAEDGIMDNPPRRVGKRLIGRYLGLRIMMATLFLTGFVVGSVFWALHLEKTMAQARSQAMAVLNFGAISVTLSARFTYNSSLHPRILFGNKFCWISIVIVIALQFFITYTPGLNKAVFGMEAMDLDQWGIVCIFMAAQLAIMEIEKAIRRILKSKNFDTDDRNLSVIDEILAKSKKNGKPGSFRVELPGHDLSSFRSVELRK